MNPCSDTQVVQLLASERRQDLSAELIGPGVQELERALGGESGAVHYGTLEECRELVCARRRVACAVSLEDVHLLKLAARRHLR